MLSRPFTFKSGVWQAAALPAIGFSLLLVVLLTAVIAAVSLVTDIGHFTIIYLIPVLVAAIRGGILPAVVAALAGIGVAAFFFYPPIYDFRVHDPVQIVDLVLFIFVAVVTGHLAASLRRAKLREQADALREAVIGSVSHELRSPLSAILGSASVLAHAAEIVKDPRLHSLTTGLRDEAERLDSQIQDLLDSTRIRSEGIQPRAEWADPGDIINAAAERKRQVLANHRLQVLIADNLPLLQIDPNLVERALGHLLENAAKFSLPQSVVKLGVERSGRTVRFYVRDQGSGLSADERGQIWERFYRSPRHESVGGSGLGLWIARALVTACGGTVDAISPGIGQGAILSFYFPVPQRGEIEIHRSGDEQ